MGFDFKFDPDAKDTTAVVYHGTRVSPDIILSEGLRFPGIDALISMIKRSFSEVGMSYNEWLEHQRKLESKGRFNTFSELAGDHRRKIWVTHMRDNAWSYAHRSPEIVSEAVRSEYVRHHIHKKKVFEEANEVLDRALAWIGKPIVVSIDAKKIGAGAGSNQPITHAIPKEYIIEIFYL